MSDILDIFTTIKKITVESATLVLDLTTGVAAPGSAPPMFMTGVPGTSGNVNVFSTPFILKPEGHAVSISDPITDAMRTNLIGWAKNLTSTGNSSNVFFFFNISSLRANLKANVPVTFGLVTPGPGSNTFKQVTYYWEIVTPPGVNQPFSGNPVSPVPVLFGKNGVSSVWTDSSFGGAGNYLLAGFTGDIQGPVDFGDPANRFHGQIDVFTTTANDNKFLGGGGKLVFSIHTQTFTVPNVVDTTSWGISAAVWKKQKAFAGLLPVPPSQTWPLPSPAVQPDSHAFTGGFSIPSKTVTVTVSPSPANVVTLT
jgi:hypothetical protein